MARQYARQLYTLEEYERMIDEGVFHEDQHIELIRGEIVEMTPIGLPHEMCVARLTSLLIMLLGNAVLVWPQNNSIRLAGNSRPEPDLTLLKRRDYDIGKPPTASDVILIIEVADSSLKYDRTVKGPLYAEAGIGEYWIVNLKDSVIEVYTDPAEGAYKQVRKARQGETLPLPGGLKGSVYANDILGE